MSKFRLFFLMVLLVISFMMSLKIFELEHQKTILKNDLIELSKIKYGLFNVDEWKKILADIISKKVEEFNLNNENKEQMRVKIQNFLTKEIDEFERNYYQEKSQSIYGIFQSGVASLTGTFGVIKKDIPKITDDILNFLDEKENRENIKKYIINKINDYADNTFSQTNYTNLIEILSKYQYSDLALAKSTLKERIEHIEVEAKPYKIILILTAFLGAILIIASKTISSSELGSFLALTLIYLFIGIMLPMIEIDARISAMNFKLLGEDVGFSNQVLYYKSKSILEVVQLMVLQGRIEMILVGFLVLIFSVLFPVSKILCSVLYLLNMRFRGMKSVKFMVFKSGKWSMADVMVIAIFMAYIGFDGIISEQLKQLEKLSPNLDMLTTNQSNLLFGFFSFTTFVLLSLIASQKIQNLWSPNTPNKNS